MAKKPKLTYSEKLADLHWEDAIPYPTGRDAPRIVISIAIPKDAKYKKIMEDEYCITFPTVSGEKKERPAIGTLTQIVRYTEGEDLYYAEVACLFRVKVVSRELAQFDGDEFWVYGWDEILDQEITKEKWEDASFEYERSVFANICTLLLLQLVRHSNTVLQGVEDTAQRDELGREYLAIMEEGSLLVRRQKDVNREEFGLLLDKTCNFILVACMRIGQDPDGFLGVRDMYVDPFFETDVMKRFLAVKDSSEHVLIHLEEILNVSGEFGGDFIDDMDDTPGDAGNKLPAVIGKGKRKADQLYEQFERVKDKLSPEARQRAEEELRKLGNQGEPQGWVRTYLEMLLGLPWGVYTEDEKDLDKVEKVLDENHWGLEKVKGRILEYLAVREQNPSAKSPTLCFVGPPGVGKTSLGESIARAMGRKFIHLSLGGCRDQAEIKGHRSTYIGALPGRIIEMIRRAGSSNPLFLLDEIDKIDSSFRGDPSATLLDVLDPASNKEFLDDYLGVHFDLSKVLFITTANTRDSILLPLQNRMETLELSSYTPSEKLQIAKNKLISRLRADKKFPIVLGDKTIDIQFTDDVILEMIHEYTNEAGVRDLERLLDRPFRQIVRHKKQYDGTVTIDKQNLEKFCGKPHTHKYTYPNVLPPGVMPILFATDIGGYVFNGEVNYNYTQGPRKLKLLGVYASGAEKSSANKIEESLRKAFNALTMHGGILFEKLKIIEGAESPIFMEGSISNGAVPKDGPSAGLVLAIMIYGKLTKQSIKPSRNVSLFSGTGEIEQNLMTVGAIGGLREKLIAAHRAGIKKVLIPKENERDLDDVPEEIKSQLQIFPISYIWEALEIVFPQDEDVKKYAAQQRKILKR